jgi:hypothetical protein
MFTPIIHEEINGLFTLYILMRDRKLWGQSNFLAQECFFLPMHLRVWPVHHSAIHWVVHHLGIRGCAH